MDKEDIIIAFMLPFTILLMALIAPFVYIAEKLSCDKPQMETKEEILKRRLNKQLDAHEDLLLSLSRK